MDQRDAIIRIRKLKMNYVVKKDVFKRKNTGVVKAVDGIDLDIYKGETLGLIGESGCGKSTLGRAVLGVLKRTDGDIFYKGECMTDKNQKKFRRHCQIIFQDPYSSLDPRMKIKSIVEEPLRIHTKTNKTQRYKAVKQIMEKMGLSEDDLQKHPHEFSGGQRQRISIARALVMGPEFIVCDEPVSALDMSVQAQILNLFNDVKREFGLTYLFISHDMSVIKFMSDRIAVMYLGKIVEIAPKGELFQNALHPYTLGLIGSIPVPDPSLREHQVLLEGSLPSPFNPPRGCSFHSRCPKAWEPCRVRPPELCEVKRDHFVLCHLFNRKERT